MYKYLVQFVDKDQNAQEIIFDNRVSFTLILDRETGLPYTISFTEGVNNLYRENGLLIPFWHQSKDCTNLKISLLENDNIQSLLFEKEEKINFVCTARIREKDDVVLSEEHNLIIGLDIS